MGFNDNNLSPHDHEHLISKLMEEIKLRKYSSQTRKLYVSVVRRFLASGKEPREYLPHKRKKCR